MNAPVAVSVPITIVASGSVTQSLTTPNTADLSFGTPTGVAEIASACLGTPAGNCSGRGSKQSFSIATSVMVTPGALYDLQMEAIAQINSGNGTDTQAASIDLFISIDPMFLLNNPDFPWILGPDS